ncbi:hypothetical protein [Alkalinema sp. FACHB-956]|nr:hypothetical protein [Alkalinema sp. FACHB-956]
MINHPGMPWAIDRTSNRWNERSVEQCYLRRYLRPIAQHFLTL